MKKILALLITPLLLSGCNGNTSESSFGGFQPNSNLKIICPTGAPSVAFYNYANSSNFETNNNVANITAYMNGGSNYDVVVLDTTSGLSAIKAGAQYKIAATITLGNFYIASTGKDTDGILDKTDTVVLFGNPNAVPAKMFNYLYGSDYNIEYCGGGVDKAASVLETGKNLSTGHDADWVFIAEPYLYSAKHNETSILFKKDYTIINVQEVYKEKSNNLPLMQASVFVKNTAKVEDIDRFLSNLKKNIEDGIANPDLIKNSIDSINDSKMAEQKFGRPSNEIKEIMKTNGLGLGYLSAKENKQAIDSYISLFGMESTNEEIYY